MVTKPAKPTEASIAIARIETLLAERDCVFVAIDGPCTSGKTTFAAMLNRRFGGNVLHMDDFFLRPEQRTPERFAEPGGNVDRERFENGSAGTARRRTSRAIPAMGLPYRRFRRRVRRRTGPADHCGRQLQHAPRLAEVLRLHDLSCGRSCRTVASARTTQSTHVATIRRRVDSAGKPLFRSDQYPSRRRFAGRHRAAGRWVGRRAGMTYTHIRREGNVKEKTNV